MFLGDLPRRFVCVDSNMSMDLAELVYGQEARLVKP